MTKTFNNMRQGVVLIICAPSGAGKTTLIKQLRERYPALTFSLSCTTRKKRIEEEDGVHYHFLTREIFEARRAEGFFAEWAEVHGNLYGTPKVPLELALASGTDVLFDIDVQGARQLKETLQYGTFAFILPPSLEILRARLQGRGTDTTEAIEKRMSIVIQELQQAPWFDAWIFNDVLETAFLNLCEVYEVAKLAPICHPHLLESILKSHSEK